MLPFRNWLNFVLCLVLIYSILKSVPSFYDAFCMFSCSLVAVMLAEWLMTNSRKYILHKTVDPKNKAILITGCDTGFGNELVKRMDKQGYTVFAGCLNKEGSGAKDLIRNCSENLTVLNMNVTDDRSIQDAKEFVMNNLKNNSLWAIVNNAGIAQAGEVDWATIEEFQAVHDVNAAGPLRVIKAFLPFIKKSKGRIINVISSNGRFHSPVYVGYCMSKSAAVALTAGLRIELAKWGLKVIGIEPFFYSTPIATIKSICELIEKAWKNASDDTREEYGETYKESLKRKAARSLYMITSPRIYEVVDCLQDAITAEEPLSTYDPRHLFFRAGLKLLSLLPNCIDLHVQRFMAEPSIKPAALMKSKYKQK